MQLSIKNTIISKKQLPSFNDSFAPNDNAVAGRLFMFKRKGPTTANLACDQTFYNFLLFN